MVPVQKDLEMESEDAGEAVPRVWVLMRGRRGLAFNYLENQTHRFFSFSETSAMEDSSSDSSAWSTSSEESAEALGLREKFSPDTVIQFA